MTVTAQDSIEYAKIVAGTPLAPYELGGRVRVAQVNYTQDGAGDANSTLELTKLPGGKVLVLGGQSRLQFSAWGTGTTLDLGHAAYTNDDGTAVAADVDDLDDGIDVSAAGSMTVGTALTGTQNKLFESESGVIITGKAIGAGIPDGATLKGEILYVVD